MTAPLEPTKIIRSTPTPVEPRRGSMLLAAVGLLLVVAAFRSHEASLFIRLPASCAGYLLVAIGVGGVRRSVYSVTSPKGPAVGVRLVFIFAGMVLGAFFLALSAPGYLTLLGMAASIALVCVGWGSLARE